MSTPTIVRKVSNLSNNDSSTNSPTTGAPIRPTRVVRVLSKSAGLANSNNSTLPSTPTTTTAANDNNNNSVVEQPTTSTVDQQGGQTATNSSTETNTPDNASSTESTNGASPSGAKKVVVRRMIVKRPVGDGAISSSNTTPSTTNNNNINNINNNTTSNNNQPTTTTTIPPLSNLPSSATNETTNNNINNTTTTTTGTTTVVNNEVNNNAPTTPRGGIADRWLTRTSSTASTTTPEAPTTPKRPIRVNRNSLKHEDKVTTDLSSTTTTTTTNSSSQPPVSNTTSSSENKTTINSSSSDFGSKLVSAAVKGSSTTNTTTTTTASSQQPSKMPETTKSVKDLASELANNFKALTPEQMMMDRKVDKGSDNIRPLRPLEIATWYGGSVSVATEDPMFDNYSVDDLKREGPDIYYTSFLFNPLFDEQSACDTPIITMSAQEVLQYNFVVELMRKRHTNLLTLDPIVFEEEMRNATNISSASLSRTLSSVHTHTESATSTEDVLSREDIGYPIQKCSKNWKYQLKKKRENAKTNFNANDGMFTPRASVQLQTSSPSSPATSNSNPVNPLYDHLYYMPCWKHQLQLDQISKRGGEQRKVQ